MAEGSPFVDGADRSGVKVIIGDGSTFIRHIVARLLPGTPVPLLASLGALVRFLELAR